MVGFYNYTVILTYLGLASSIVGMSFTLSGDFRAALFCLLFSGLCDCLDGKVARTMKRTDEEKRFGIQIDSLCDVICFGVYPAIIGYSLGLKSTAGLLVLIFYVLTGIIRLAYFNVTEETRQSKTDAQRSEYIGVPISTAALAIPFAFLFRPVFGAAFPLAYAIWLLIVGLLYIAPLRVPKVHGKGIVLIIAIGAAIFAGALLLV